MGPSGRGREGWNAKWKRKEVWERKEMIVRRGLNDRKGKWE